MGDFEEALGPLLGKVGQGATRLVHVQLGAGACAVGRGSGGVRMCHWAHKPIIDSSKPSCSLNRRLGDNGSCREAHRAAKLIA